MTDEELEQLLPWYVNDTLNPEEKTAVEALLERSEAARQELAFLRSLSGRINDEALPQPSDLGWRRLQRELRSEQQSFAQRWWKPGIAAAAVAVVALQTTMLLRQPDPYEGRLLGASTQLQQPHWLVQLRFSEDTSWQQVRAVVTAAGGSIVDGPSGIGVIRIAVPKQEQQFGDTDQLLNWLQQQDSVDHAAIESP